MNSYIPLLLLVVVAIALALIILGLAQLVTRWVRKNAPKTRLSVYESGVNPIGNARLRFSIKFYLISMIFIIFDIEVVFFYPWAVIFRDVVRDNPLVFWEMIVFIAILALGYVWVWRKGGLDWD